MTDAPDPIGPLRAALEVTPDNGPLRRLLADTLAAHGRSGEAEDEYRELLRRDAGDDDARLALARCYLDAGKTSHAAVIVDLLAGRERPAPEALLVLARIKLAEGDPAGARSAFRRAVEADPELARSPEARALGLAGETEGPSAAPFDADDEGEAPDFGPAAERELASGDPDDEGEGRVTDNDFERPKLRFEDVGGMEDVKEEISMKVIQPLAHPELFAAYGKAVGGGVLMYGPPGCGKTHLARATAGEAKAAFMSIGIHEVLEMWIGSSERNLHRVFDEARRRAPCVLFFDEVDALGAKRGDAGNAGARRIINQFLSELDGVQDSNEGLLILAATNAPWHLDAAFRRPGRFDRLIFVPPPDEAARAAILGVMLRGKPAGDVDAAKVAKKTKGFSGADLKGLVDRAVEVKLRDALKSGRPSPLSTKDLLSAARGMAPTTTEWFGTAKNHVQFANQSGHYDDVARYLGMGGKKKDGE